VRVLLSVLLCCGPLMADLAQVRAEPNLEKRSKAALDNAEQSLAASRKAYAGGDLTQAAVLLDEMELSVDLAENSLKDTNKDPSRSPKYFKNAEIKTGDLLRKLDAFSRDMNVADRPLADKSKEKVQEAHDRLLQAIMTGKKKKK
jgi:hypothetical protein